MATLNLVPQAELNEVTQVRRPRKTTEKEKMMDTIPLNHPKEGRKGQVRRTASMATIARISRPVCGQLLISKDFPPILQAAIFVATELGQEQQKHKHNLRAQGQQNSRGNAPRFTGDRRDLG